MSLDASKIVMDDSIGIALEYQVQRYDPRLYETKYPALMGRMIVPTTVLGENPLIYAYSMEDIHGSAKIISDYASDLPKVDVSADLTQVKVHDIGISANWSWKEVQTLASASVPAALRSIDTRRLDAMRLGIEREFDRLLAYGDSVYGLRGFTNHPSVNAANVALNAGSSSRLWANKTPDEIFADIAEAYLLIMTNTNSIEIPDTLALPPAKWASLGFRRLSDLGNETVLTFLQAKMQGLNPNFQIVEWNRLTGAGASGTDRFVIYKRDPAVVEGIIAQEFTRFAPVRQNLNWEVPGVMSTAGVVVRYPKAMEYRDGF